MPTFRTTRYPALMLRMGDLRAKFRGGTFDTDDEELAQAIRDAAASNADLGISESDSPAPALAQVSDSVTAPEETERVGDAADAEDTVDAQDAADAIEAEEDVAAAIENEPDPAADLTVAELRAELAELGLDTEGRKPELQERLRAARE